MNCLPLLVSALLLAACGKDNTPNASGEAMPAALPRTIMPQGPDTAKKSITSGTFSGIVGLWSSQPAAAIATAASSNEADQTTDTPPVLAREQRMADEIRKFKEGQRQRELRSDHGYSNPTPGDREGDKIALRPGDLASKASSPAAATQATMVAITARPRVVDPEKLQAAKQRMADEIKKFKEGQALRRAQSSNLSLTAESAMPVNQAGDKSIAGSAGLRLGDRVGLRSGDVNAH